MTRSVMCHVFGCAPCDIDFVVRTAPEKAELHIARCPLCNHVRARKGAPVAMSIEGLADVAHCPASPPAVAASARVKS